MSKNWYAVHTYSGHENKVKILIEGAARQEGLSEQFGRILIPTEEVVELKRTTKRKLFPSYLMVEMEFNAETANLVKNTQGVTDFVGQGAKAHPVPQHEVDRILHRIESDTDRARVSVPFRKGESVLVIEGPFTEFQGVVEDVNHERMKVKVLVSIFGRATPVELDYRQVKSIA
jgi:transcriptional antiterminator NusG